VVYPANADLVTAEASWPAAAKPVRTASSTATRARRAARQHRASYSSRTAGSFLRAPAMPAGRTRRGPSPGS